jgi:glycerophosphoryl diester phosphodiesterase
MINSNSTPHFFLKHLKRTITKVHFEIISPPLRIKLMVEWISHRGYCKSAMENTAAAFRAAESVGFFQIETDLRMTSDHHIVLCHDENLWRTAGLSLPVQSASRAQLEQITLKDGSPLMFLDQLLDQFSHLKWTFDIKEPGGSELIERIAALVKQRGLVDWISTHVTFLCWSDAVEELIRGRYPNARIYARFEECQRAGFAHLLRLGFLSGVQPHKIYSLPPRVAGINLFAPTLVKQYHEQGVRVLAFLPRSSKEANAAIRSGFDQILSDHPPLS